LSEQGKRKVSFFRGKVHFFQDKRHRISVDLVLFLSRIRGIRKSSRVADLGAGFGFLSICTALKHGCKVLAVERDKAMVEMLRENIEINGAGGLVEVFRGDVRNIKGQVRRGTFDVVICNPPFFLEGSDGVHHEGDTSLGDFIDASSFLLRDGGYLNLMIPSFRLSEAFGLLVKNNLHPRFLTAVFPRIDKNCRICFVTSIRNVPGPLSFERPLIVNEPDGSYTQEVSRLLEGYVS